MRASAKRGHGSAHAPPAARHEHPHDEHHHGSHRRDRLHRRITRALAKRATPSMLVGLLVVAAVLAGVVLYLERGGTDLRLADDGATVTLAPGQEAVVSLPGGAWQFDTGSGRDVVELVDGPVRTCGRYATSDCTNLFRVRARQPGSVDIHLSCLFLCPSRPGTATPTAQWRVHVTVPDPTKLR